MVLRWTCGIYMSRGTGSLLIRGRCIYTPGGTGRGIYTHMHNITGIYIQVGNGPPRRELTYYMFIEINPSVFYSVLIFAYLAVFFQVALNTMAFINIEDHMLVAGAGTI